MPLLTILAYANLTDFLITNFGWEWMQTMWDPLFALWDALYALFPWGTEMLTKIWEVLFT